MPRFYVWPIWWGEPDQITDAVEMEAFDEGRAAEAYVESHHSDLDYPDQVEVFVQPISGGERSTWDVRVEVRPDAYARRVEPDNTPTIRENA